MHLDFLPGFFNRGDSKQIVRFFAEPVVQEPGHQHHECDKCQQDKKLASGRFLNILFVFYITNFTRAVLNFIFKKEGIKHASQADSENRFKEQKYKAYKTDNPGNRTIGIYNDKKDEHGG